MKQINQEQLLQHISDTYTDVLRGGTIGILYDGTVTRPSPRSICPKCWEVKRPGKLTGLLNRAAKKQFIKDEEALKDHLSSIEHIFEQHGLDSEEWVEDINLIKLSVGICEDERKSAEEVSSVSSCSSMSSSSSSSESEEDDDDDEEDETSS